MTPTPDLRALIQPHMPEYLSTACQTAKACWLAAEVFPDRADELTAWAEREHASCRITRKQDMTNCECDCHELAAQETRQTPAGAPTFG